MTYARDNSTHDDNFYLLLLKEVEGLLVVFVDVIIVDALHRSRVDTGCR